MILTKLLPLFIVHLYAILSVCALFAFFKRSEKLKKFTLILAYATLTIQGLDLALTLAEGTFSRAFFLMIIAWSIGLVALFSWQKLGHSTLFLLTMPIITGIYLFAMFYRQVTFSLPPSLSTMFFSIHIASLSLSWACIVIAFLAALLYLEQKHRLKTKRPVIRFFKNLPSLTLLDRVNKWSVYAGFPLYSLGLISGFLNNFWAYGQSFTHDPKEWMSLAIWLFYACFFGLRLRSRLYGKRAAIFAICLFVAGLFSLTVLNKLFATTHNLVGL